MKITSKKQDISFINVKLNFIFAKLIFISAKLIFISAKLIFICDKLNFISAKLIFVFAKETCKWYSFFIEPKSRNDICYRNFLDTNLLCLFVIEINETNVICYV